MDDFLHVAADADFLQDVGSDLRVLQLAGFHQRPEAARMKKGLESRNQIFLVLRSKIARTLSKMA